MRDDLPRAEHRAPDAPQALSVCRRPAGDCFPCAACGTVARLRPPPLGRTARRWLVRRDPHLGTAASESKEAAAAVALTGAAAIGGKLALDKGPRAGVRTRALTGLGRPSSCLTECAGSRAASSTTATSRSSRCGRTGRNRPSSPTTRRRIRSRSGSACRGQLAGGSASEQHPHLANAVRCLDTGVVVTALEDAEHRPVVGQDVGGEPGQTPRASRRIPSDTNSACPSR